MTMGFMRTRLDQLDAAPKPVDGMTLRQAALVAGLGLLVMCAAAPFADRFVYPRLVIAGNIEQTIQNIAAHRGLFMAAICAYLVNYVCDMVVAWGLYVLLAPVNRSLSLLTAWFRLMYTALALFATFKLVTVFNLLDTPYDLTLFGSVQLHAQVKLLLDSFRSDWGMALVLFGIHLALLGMLVYRSGYIPKIIGILLIINGVGWMTNSLGPYLFPGVNFGFLFVTFFAELIFMLWLLARGWKIVEPAGPA
ncbi:MAG: DUF4386 domain-containing protein [Terracidiphilus sp.]